jgi:patatin-like phospholipase/acyl hydrolase
MVYRVLSIDGGGIRGIYSLMILKYIEEEVDKDFIAKIDCFVGTSTGALIATCLNLGFSPSKLLFYYKYFGAFSFPKNKDGGAKYHIKRLRFFFRTLILKNLHYRDLKKDLIVPSCILFDEEKGGWSEKIYDTFSSFDESIVDVALRSSSSPIYFPSYQGHIDGGIFSVNPSIIAYSRLIDKNLGAKEKDSIRFLSLGTGINPLGIKQDIDWGVKDWMDDRYLLIEIFTDLGSEAPNYPMEQILKENFRRINSPLLENVPIDDITKIDVLIKSAKSFKENQKGKWEEDKKWLKEHFLGLN